MKTADLRSNVELDEFVSMPNHFHGILVIARNSNVETRKGAAALRPYKVNPRGATERNVQSNALGAIIRSFKSIATKRINEIRGTQGAPAWQRNYWEHIIRSEKDWERIRKYIVNNPANWELDQENPRNVRSAEMGTQRVERDTERDGELVARGLHVLRFKNREIKEDVSDVLARIVDACHGKA